MRKKDIELVVLVIVVALGVLFLSDRKPSEIDPLKLKVNDVSIGQTRLKIEDVLEYPTFEKRTDLASYGWRQGVSVEYDGSEQSSIASRIHGSQLTLNGRVVLTQGDSVERARSVLGNRLSARADFDSYYRIRGTETWIRIRGTPAVVHGFQSGIRQSDEIPVTP